MGKKVFDFVGSLLVNTPYTDVVGTLKMSVGVSRDCTQRERELCERDEETRSVVYGTDGFSILFIDFYFWSASSQV